MPIYKMEGKKDGQQKYRVRINFINDSGKAKQIDRVVYGLSEAKELESRLLKTVAEKDVPAKNMTLRELADEYLINKAIEVRETSLATIRTSLRLYIIPYLGDRKLKNLNSKILQNWKLEVNSLNFKIKTRQNIFGEFRALLNYAVKMEYIPRNPLLIIGNFKDAYQITSTEKIKYYTTNEFKRYISKAEEYAAQSNNYGFYVFFCVAFFTGLRKGDDCVIIGLNRKSADKYRLFGLVFSFFAQAGTTKS